MVGDIKAISPCVKSASAKLFLDLHTVSAPSGEERTLGASAQVERAALCFRRFSGAKSRAYGGCAAESEPLKRRCGVRSLRAARERLCTRAPRYFHPYPVHSWPRMMG